MDQAIGFMPKISAEQRMWDLFISSLEGIVSDPSNIEGNSVSAARELLIIMDGIDAGLINYNFLYYHSSNEKANEVYKVLLKIIPQYVVQYHTKNAAADPSKFVYKQVVQGLIQGIKTPLRKIDNSESVSLEEISELATLISAAKDHCVSYSMERVD